MVDLSVHGGTSIKSNVSTIHRESFQGHFWRSLNLPPEIFKALQCGCPVCCYSCSKVACDTRISLFCSCSTFTIILSSVEHGVIFRQLRCTFREMYKMQKTLQILLSHHFAIYILKQYKCYFMQYKILRFFCNINWYFLI